MRFNALVLLLCLPSVMGFGFMATWKIPQLSAIGKSLQAAEKFGDRKIVVITGASSGLGRQTTKHLVKNGGWHVVCAVRDCEKMALVAEEEGFEKGSFSVMECDLNSFQSVRTFASQLQQFKCDRPLDRLVLNAAVYQPSLDYAKYSEDNIEQQMQTNFLSQFLLSSLLIDDLRKAPKARLIGVGSVTGNDNTVGGGGVYPTADLRELEGLAEMARVAGLGRSGMGMEGGELGLGMERGMGGIGGMIHEGGVGGHLS
ncbi:hypothetical protein B484DRAFT_414837 [Ochromonadaceae sp. CCMP2298]|nr:hypothetical protein B484DRAFT_414837 [Ochromonadaceae sp. CCMP2298]